MKDKQLEINRYDERAQEILNKKKYKVKIPSYLNVAHEYYFDLFKKLKKKTNLLEIGAGTGEYTVRLIKMSFNVCATDISSKSVKVLNKRFSRYENFSSKVADMEKLPFKNESFDVICSAGSLSYGDNDLVMNELYRVLKFDGIVVFVDSLNNSPIYRFNRYLHYLKGNRSKSTLERTADISLLKKYIKKFGCGKISFFGSITWTFPLLRIFLSEKLLTKFSNWIDLKFNIKGSAFKFVSIFRKKNVRKPIKS